MAQVPTAPAIRWEAEPASAHAAPTPPSRSGVRPAGFSSGAAVKAWLGTAAFALVLVQVVSARRMYRGGGRAAPLVGPDGGAARRRRIR